MSKFNVKIMGPNGVRYVVIESKNWLDAVTEVSLKHVNSDELATEAKPILNRLLFFVFWKLNISRFLDIVISVKQLSQRRKPNKRHLLHQARQQLSWHSEIH